VLSRITTLLALALALGMIAAGCGDDDDVTTSVATTTTTEPGATDTAETLSKEQWIGEADAICEAGDEEIRAAAEELFSGGANPGKAEEEAFVTQTLVPAIQEQIDQLRGLTPPKGDVDEINAFLDSAQQGIDELEQNPRLAGTSRDPLNETTQLAKEYGLQVCAQG
jgi:hypothetical protein